MLLKGFYAITDEHLTPHETILAQVEEALSAGVGILQYRNKTLSDAQIEPVCLRLQALCREYGALFIIDDRPRLAQKIGADGLHIGQHDTELSLARKIFPDGIIGVSCYGSVRKALEAQKAGADYVAFGSFFPSPTKPLSGIVPISVLSRAKEALFLPVCAIGGINATNIDQIAAHHPDMISLVSAIWTGDITQNIQRLTQQLKQGTPPITPRC